MLVYLVRVFLLIIISTNNTFGQVPIKFSLFKKPNPTGFAQNNYVVIHSQPPTLPVISNNNAPQGYEAVDKQNQLILKRMGILQGHNLQKQHQEESLEEIKKEDRLEKESWIAKMEKPFLNNLQEFLSMDTYSYSITKAIYLSESAWYNNPPTFNQFENEIKLKADEVRFLLMREGLSLNTTSINYGIQKLYEQDNQFISKSKNIITVKKLSYDFNDFDGKKNYANLFVTKLLSTGSGQCHSLPLLYLCLAEQLGGKAFLSMAPQHQFIQFFDENGYKYNYETTSGHLVSQTWLMQNTYVNATAIRNKTFLDTLSNKRLYAQILSDLLKSFVDKIGFNNTSEVITNKILLIDSTNISALMVQANYYTKIALQELKYAGNPPIKKLSIFPRAFEAYKKMLESYSRIDKTGYQDMSEDAYKNWLQSIEIEKQKQRNKNLIDRQRKDIELLKKIRKPIQINHN